MQFSTLVVDHVGVIITISVAMAAPWKHPLQVYPKSCKSLRYTLHARHSCIIEGSCVNNFH